MLDQRRPGCNIPRYSEAIVCEDESRRERLSERYEAASYPPRPAAYRPGSTSVPVPPDTHPHLLLRGLDADPRLDRESYVGLLYLSYTTDEQRLVSGVGDLACLLVQLQGSFSHHSSFAHRCYPPEPAETYRLRPQPLVTYGSTHRMEDGFGATADAGDDAVNSAFRFRQRGAYGLCRERESLLEDVGTGR